MAQENRWKKDGLSYVVLDCTLSKFADDIWKNWPEIRQRSRNIQYWVYNILENKYTELLKFLQDLKRTSTLYAFYAERTLLNGQIQRKVCYQIDKCEDVPENFAHQFVSAYVFDPKNSEHKERLKTIFRTFFSRVENTIEEVKRNVLKDLEEQVEKHCQTLGKFSVAQLRKLMENVLKATQISPSLKDRMRIRMLKWNKKTVCRWLSFQKEVKVDEVPEHFMCPINFTVMAEPVVLPNGTTIDLSAFNDIKERAKPRPPKNPITQEPLSHDYEPIRNLLVKTMIEEFLQDHAIRRQY